MWREDYFFTYRELQAGNPDELAETLLDHHLRSPSEDLLGLANVGQRVTRIARPRRNLDGCAANHRRDPIDAYVAAASDVQRATVRNRRVHGEQIGADHVSDVGEIAALLAVAPSWPGKPSKSCSRERPRWASECGWAA